MQKKSVKAVRAILLTVASLVLTLPASAIDRSSNQSGKLIDEMGTSGSLRMALTAIHERVGAQFVILGGPDAYHQIDVMFYKATTLEEAVHKIAALAHASVIRCCPDTYLFQPVTKQSSRRLFTPKQGLQWRKLMLPYPLPTELPSDFGWEFWDKGWYYDHVDENVLVADYPDTDHIKLPQGVEKVYALPSGDTLLVYSTASGFQQIRKEMQKTDLRRATFSTSVLTAPAADMQALGNIPKIITDETMQHIRDQMHSDSTSYLDGSDFPQTVPQGQPAGLMETGLQSKPDDLKVNINCIPKFNNDGTVTVNAQAELLRFHITRAADGSYITYPPDIKKLSSVSETETLRVGDVLALQGLAEPNSAGNPGNIRQVIIFVKLTALSQHTSNRTN